MPEHTGGWNRKAVLKERIAMYKRFNKKNPQVAGILPLLTMISLLSMVYYITAIIYYCLKIDEIIMQEYAHKSVGVNDNVHFDDDLISYLKQNYNV